MPNPLRDIPDIQRTLVDSEPMMAIGRTVAKLGQKAQTYQPTTIGDTVRRWIEKKRTAGQPKPRTTDINLPQTGPRDPRLKKRPPVRKTGR